MKVVSPEERFLRLSLAGVPIRSVIGSKVNGTELSIHWKSGGKNSSSKEIILCFATAARAGNAQHILQERRGLALQAA